MFFNQSSKCRARAAWQRLIELQAIDVALSGIAQCHKKENLKQFDYLLFAVL